MERTQYRVHGAGVEEACGFEALGAELALRELHVAEAASALQLYHLCDIPYGRAPRGARLEPR